MRRSRHTHASRSKIHELAGGDHLSSTIIARAESRKNFSGAAVGPNGRRVCFAVSPRVCLENFIGTGLLASSHSSSPRSSGGSPELVTKTFCGLLLCWKLLAFGPRALIHFIYVYMRGIKRLRLRNNMCLTARRINMCASHATWNQSPSALTGRCCSGEHCMYYCLKYYVMLCFKKWFIISPVPGCIARAHEIVIRSDKIFQRGCSTCDS